MAAPPQLPRLTPEEEAETNLPRIMGVIATFHFLALSFVAVRLYTRFVVIKSPKIDDIFMILATLGGFCGMLCIILQAPRGLGRHKQIISDENYETLRLLNWVYSLTCVIIAFSILKISIALSLLRLSRVRWYVYSLYALMGFIVCYTIIALVSFMAACTPIEAGWKTLKTAKCYSRETFAAFSIFNNACSMFSDVVCATLPIPIIWTLKMKLRTRLYLVAVLSLGYLTVGMGGVKAYYQIGAKRDPDGFFEQNIQFYGFLQFNLGIIVACAPTLRPLLGRALKLSSHDKFSGGYYGDNGSKRTGPNSTKRRTAIQGQEFELEETRGFEHSLKVKTTINGASNDSGSEEMILQGTEKGILRTTEIDVR